MSLIVESAAITVLMVMLFRPNFVLTMMSVLLSQDAGFVHLLASVTNAFQILKENLHANTLKFFPGSFSSSG